jgi:hypothetical protein
LLRTPPIIGAVLDFLAAIQRFPFDWQRSRIDCSQFEQFKGSTPVVSLSSFIRLGSRTRGSRHNPSMPLGLAGLQELILRPAAAGRRPPPSDHFAYSNFDWLDNENPNALPYLRSLATSRYRYDGLPAPPVFLRPTHASFFF